MRVSRFLTEGQSTDIDTTRSDIRADQESNITRFESFQVALSFLWTSIGMQTDTRETMFVRFRAWKIVHLRNTPRESITNLRLVL